jgi:hypothetical protein
MIAEIITCVSMGARRPEDRPDVRRMRERIEFDQAFLDALNMIEISADCDGGNCWSAELLDRWHGRESRLIKALILAGDGWP